MFAKLFFVLFFIVKSNAFHSRSEDSLNLIREAGYRGEAHQVQVQDAGWILKIHRIPPKYKKGVKPIPVFLMHGLFAGKIN